MTLFPARNYSNCTFPRLTLHACALTRTISLSYRGISLSFHLVTEVFQLFTHYFSLPVQFQLKSDFSYTFLNGKLTCRIIIIIIIIIINRKFFSFLAANLLIITYPDVSTSCRSPLQGSTEVELSAVI